jgi:hypothetical protein
MKSYPVLEKDMRVCAYVHTVILYVRSNILMMGLPVLFFEEWGREAKKEAERN